MINCAGSRQTDAEFQEVKTEVINNEFNIVFNSTISALREQGFYVNLIDKLQGQISAEYRFTRNSDFNGDFFEGYNPRAATSMRIDASLKELNNNRTFIEITLLESFPPPQTSYNIRIDEGSTRVVRRSHQYDTIFMEIKTRAEQSGADS
ncbi:MAG: hypothetical protein EA364_03235 [Balneolaceae bacterium]|nr:MAG: hypothetical protein EA364_03235 [Balneolaceae bacterium]